MQRVKLGFVSRVPTFLGVTLGIVITLGWAATAQAQPTNLAVTVRHAPSFNGNGLIEGSLQQLLGENATLNGGFTMTGDLLVPGTPSLRVNGNPTFAGTIAGIGGTSPIGYQITLNGNCSLNHLRTRTTPVSLPTVTAPPQPVGTRSVTINNTGQSIGDPATLRNLTLNGNVGQVTVPPGTYGTFTANGGSGFVFGVAGTWTPTVYNLQNLNLNGQCRLDIVGPVILTVANGFTANGMAGTTNHSSWLQLQIANGGFTLNGGCTVHGSVTAPAGTVIVNGNSLLVGSAQCDRLTINGGGCIKAGGSGGAANQPPTANSQNPSTPEDTALTLMLTGSDPEGASLIYTLLSQPAHGTLNQFIYTPNANFNGSDSFTFKINDGQADSAAATILIAVTPVNDWPVALAQSQSTPEDTPLEITLVGTDVDRDPLTYQIVTPPSKGTLNPQPSTLNGFTYTPASNANGLDSFKFRVSDGQLSATNTVTITISPVNDRPVAGSQTVTTDEDTPVPVVLSALDVEGDGLTFTNLTQPAHGTLTFNSQPSTLNQFIYTPATNYNGNDSFQFIASDGWLDSTPATISLIIKPVNDAPVADPQVIITPEDTATNLVLTATDVEGDSLSFTLLTAPTNGTLSGTAPNLVFSPAADFNGTNTFEFVASDGQATSAPVVVTLIVTPVNDQPIAEAQAANLDEDTPTPITLRGTDVDGDPLTFFIVTQPTNCTLTLNSLPGQSGATTGQPSTLNQYIYTPATNFSGVDSFTFGANDGTTNSLPATVTLTIHAVNDVPVAEPDAMTVEEGSVGNVIDVLANDTDADNPMPPFNAGLTVVAVGTPAHGTVFNQTTNVLYTPEMNYFGEDSFSYTIADGSNATATAVVQVTVTNINDAPVAQNLDVNTLEDQPANGNLVATDVDGDNLTFALGTPAMKGAATVNAAGHFTYIPNPNTNGNDHFTFTVTDGSATATGMVNVVIAPVNDPPVATPQTVTTDENTPLAIVLTGTDVDGDTLTFQIVNQPAHGTLNPLPGQSGATTGQPLTLNKYIYIPATDYNGPDSFTFKVNDGRLDSAPATVTINVQTVTSALQLNVPGNQETPQDAPLAFEGERRITIRGGKAGSGTLTLSLSVTNGTLTLGSMNGLIVISGADGTSSLAVSGSQNDLNTALDGSIYLGNPCFVGVDAIVLMVEDLGSPGSMDSKVVPITVLPILTFVYPFIGAVQAAPFVITYDALHWNSDIGCGVSFRVESLTSGTLSKDGQPLEYGASLISPGESVVWTPPSDAVGQVEAFRIVAWDGTHQSSNSVPVYVEAHAPMHLNVPGEQTIPHNMLLLFGPSRLISITDEDAGLGVLELSLSVSNGTLTLGSDYGLNWQAGANGTSTLVVRGYLGDLNADLAGLYADLAGLRYHNSTGFSGTDLLSVTVDDVGNNDLGINFTDAKTIPITVIAPPNNPPNVSIVAPADTSQFQFGQTIAVEATATDGDGQVKHVTLLADGQELAELTAPPFATAWTNATLGRHVLSAVATDNQGVAFISSGISIWVVDENGDFLVEAGPDQIISLPNTAFLAGTVEIQMPVAGGQTNVTWSKLDGPDDMQFSDPNALNTSVQFSEPGSYTLKLQVVYAGGTRSDLLKVDVLPAPPNRLTAARSNRGTDFWLTFLYNEPSLESEPPYAGFKLYINAGVDTTVNIGGVQDSYPQRFQVSAGSSTTVPVYPGYATSSDSIHPDAIHITADHPVTVYGLNYFIWTTDGFLALPTAMLGTDYIVLTYRNSPSWRDPEYIDGGTEFAVVATEDDTLVTITPSASADSRIAGVPYEIILQQGETYRLINFDGPDADFTGTTIQSDKPVAVFGGHACALVPPSTPAGDHLVEQLTPVNTWGCHFVTMPLAARTKGDTFRFLAATNGTRVAINGKIVASLDRAQFYEQIIDSPAEILASQPILVAQYANGSDFDGTMGDPFMMLVPPFEQFGGEYILNTAQVLYPYEEHPWEIYTNNYVNLTVRSSGVGTIFLDDVLVPAGCFQQIGTSGYAGAQVFVSPGVHHLSAPVPFGTCVYGWAPYESYGFTGGFYSESAEPDTKLELTQPMPFAATGHEKTVFVRVTSGRSLPIPDLEVSFSVSGANVAAGKAITSRLGRAAFSYTGANSGVDVITASLADFEQSVTNTWIAGSENAPPVVSTANTRPRQFSRTIELAGLVTDDNLPAGENLHVQWRLLDGPADVQFENAAQPVTHAVCPQSGQYEFELCADDSQFSACAPVSVLVDDIPEMTGYEIPSLAPVSSPIEFRVDAWDNDGTLDRVEFYANDSLIGTASPPDWGTGYGVNWIPSTNGWFQIRAVAFDDLGGSNSLDLGTIQVSYPPQVLIDNPSSGTVVTVPTNVLIHATANDPDGTVVSVSIYVNGDLLGTSDGPDISVTWIPRREGNYTLTAVVTDDLGLTTSEDVAVTVTGDFPQVTLYPNYTNQFGQTYIQLPFGVPFDLRADAWMPGPYHITNVTFYAGNSRFGDDPIGSFSESPYQLSWTYQNIYCDSIKVVAEADSGAIGEAEARLRLYELLSVAFASPSASKPVAVGMPTPIRLSVEDPGHVIETFDYYVNGELFVETTNSDPVFWQPPAPGKYELRAQAQERIWTWPPPDDGATISVTANFAFLNDGVSIVNPNDGDSLYVGSPAPICLAFEDPTGDFDHAEIFTNGVSLGQTTNSWFDWVPEQTNDYSLTAVAYDHQGNHSVPGNAVLVHVLMPPAPVVVITSPKNGDRLGLGQETLVAVDVNDPAQAVTNLELVVDGVKVMDSLDSYIPWTPGSIGSHQLTAVAADWNGHRVASAPVNVSVVEMHPPTVTVTSPADGIHFTAETLPPLVAAASDLDGIVTNLTLELDGTMLGETNGTTLELSATNVLGGWHTVIAHATDNDGLTTASTAVSFFIERSEDASLPVPAQLAAQAVSATEIRLGWQSLPTNTPASRVLVERWSTDLSAWIEIGKVSIGETNYANPSLSPETSYRYRAATTDDKVHRSAYSAEAQATTRTVVPNYSVIDLTEALIASLTGRGAGANILTNSGLNHFDWRRTVPLDAGHAESVLGTNATALKLAVARFKEQWPQIQLDYDPVLLSPKSVLPRLGYLTGPGGAGVTVSDATAQMFDPDDPDRPVKAFLQEYQALFGFGPEALDDANVQRDYVSAGNSAHTVVWQQQVAGVPVFNALLIGHMTQAGELACLSSEFIPSAIQAADPALLAAVQSGAGLPLPVQQALVTAVTNIGDRFTAGYVVAETDATGATRQQTFTATDGFKGDARAELTWFPASRTQLKLCWQVLFTSQWRDEMYLTLVSADTGEILYRRNLTTESSAVTCRVYTNASPTPLLPGWSTSNTTQPTPVERGLVTFTALDDTASPNGWINDGDNETRGNNVDAQLDRNDDNLADLPRPTGNPSRVFDFPLDLTTAPANYGEAATVQLFYWDNWMHDALYQLGFTEAAGNFQTDNFGRGGLGNDAVQADAQDGLGLKDGRHANNANMSTPPDGCAPRMQMYVFDGASPARDGSLDAQIVLHEYTHGLSTRLVGGGVGIDALQTAGLGEGWSDFYALALLTDPATDVDGVYPMASYVAYHGFGTTFDQNYYYGIRRYPYCTDTNKNPLTFADIDPWKASAHDGVPRNPLLGLFRADLANEVHSQGEVWCMMLWEMRANLIRKHGPEAGNNLALQLVTDGLKLSPPNPNFVQARDAILLADRMWSGGANAPEIWSAFAKRGLGFNAKAPESYTTAGAQESHDLMPALATERVEIQGGSGSVELGVNDNLLIHLRNQGDTAATHVFGRLATAMPGVAVLQSLSTYSDIPQGGSRANDAVFQIQTGTGFVEGTPIDLAFVITSDQSAGTNYLRLFTGVPGAEILFDNYSALADPATDSSVTKDLTPMDLGNLEPLWMADDASCLLTIGHGKYLLWRLNAEPVQMLNAHFLAHRLTRNGVVVGRMEANLTFDIFGNRLSHTYGAKWVPGEKNPVALTLDGDGYRFPKTCLLYTNVGSAYDFTVQPPTWLGFVTNYPTLQDIWDMDSGGQAVGAASVYVQPKDADRDGVISRMELEFSLIERHEFAADRTLNWLTVTERGANAGYNNTAVMQINYNAMLTSAAQFDPIGGWRWLGPLNFGLGGSLFSTALLANDAGTIAGYGAAFTGNATVDALMPTHAFRLSDSREFTGTAPILQDLGVLSGGLYSFPRAINRLGQLVGYSQYQPAGSAPDFHGVFWDVTDVAPQDLRSLMQVKPEAPPAGFSDAYAINNHKQIVGTSHRVSDGASAAVLWQYNHDTNGTPFWEITDLNRRLTDASWYVLNAVGINDDGLILAHALKTSHDQLGNAKTEDHAALLVTAQLAVDANRDGEITFDDADLTTQNQPYRFWLNDDMDESKLSSLFSEDEPEVYPPSRPDSGDRAINSARDCEDLTRLWLDTGNLVDYLKDAANDFYIGLKWENVGGKKPAIRLFRSADTSGGLGHIKDATIAAKQASDFSSCLMDADYSGIDQIKLTDRLADFIFTKHTFADLDKSQSKLFLLFEGVSEGKGELRLVFLKKNSNGSWTSMGEGPGVWLDLKNIRRMYVRAYSTPLPDKFPLPWQNAACKQPPDFPYLTNWLTGSLYIPVENLGYGIGDSTPSDENQAQYPFDAPPGEQTKCVVFVHGIDVTVAEQQGYAQSFYKRLWWEGYCGRLVTFRWATTLDNRAFTPFADRENISIFNSGEYRSWYGGTSLRNYVGGLRAQLGNDETISVAAHSLGNACVGAALRQGMQINSYVAMEAAVPLSCYYAETEDPPTDSSLVRADSASPTPRYASELGYQGYLSDIDSGAVNRASYYNADDFWLVTGTLNPAVKLKMEVAGGLSGAWLFNQIKNVDWITSQRKHKPDDRYGLGEYKYESQSGLPRQASFERGRNYSRSVSDQFEGMAFIARSRTRPLGAGEPPQKFSGLDLKTVYKFDRERSCHSGQFQRNIQLMYGDKYGKQWLDENGGKNPFYNQLMRDLHVGP
jgi:VCBS repeat-containing protein